MGSSRLWVLIGYPLWLVALWFMGSAVRRAQAAAQAHRVATSPVLLAPLLVTNFAVDIQTGRRNEVKAMVPTCSCL